VVGGSTPAAQAADWVTSLLDQVGGLWVASPFATRAEAVVLRWLKDLFGLPPSYGGVLTPSATFANLTGLACARHWWAGRHGVDATIDGLGGLPRMPVLSSGYVHPSSRKALQVLGCGRDTVQVFARDDAGRVDLAAMDRALAVVDGPAVIIGTAGEVNAGDFDPIADLADLADRHDTWLHVGGAFGLFAAVSPRTAHLVAGVERADSIAADAHKWLNVPYESGFAFVREPENLGRAFGGWNARYLEAEGDIDINYNSLGPESSRRAPGTTDLGDAARLRPAGVPDHGRAPPRPGPAARPAGGGGTRPGAARARAALRRLLPVPPARRTGSRTGRAEPAAGSGAARRRPGLRRNHGVPRRARVAPGDRQLADHRGRHRPFWSPSSVSSPPACVPRCLIP
jgi:pyridoxal-dependent decarboxylase-like protein